MASTAEDLFDAIEAEDAARVRAILADEPGLGEARDEHGVSALMRALYRFQPTLVEAVREHVGRLDVFEAATVGDTDRLRELLRGDAALATTYSADGFTPLHFAAFFGHPDVAELLLGNGAEVDALGRGFMTGTALHSATAASHAEIVRMLVEAGAKPNLRQEGGATPLHAAVANADIASIDALLAHGADPSLTKDDGESILERAEQRGDEATIERIRAALQAAP
jgi:ankyrin repeat protein